MQTFGICFVSVLALLFILFLIAQAKGVLDEVFTIFFGGILAFFGMVVVGFMLFIGMLIAWSPFIILIGVVLLMIKWIF